MRNVISPEEVAELNRLDADLAATIGRQNAILAKEGMNSPLFLAADRAVGAILRRKKEILGEV